MEKRDELGNACSITWDCFGFCVVYHLMSCCMLEVLGMCPCTFPGDPAGPVQKLCKKAFTESSGCEGVRSLVRRSLQDCIHIWRGRNCVLGCSKVIGFTSAVIKQPVGEVSPGSSKKGIQRQLCSFMDGYQPASLREKKAYVWENGYATPSRWQLGCSH